MLQLRQGRQWTCRLAHQQLCQLWLLRLLQQAWQACASRPKKCP